MAAFHVFVCALLAVQGGKWTALDIIGSIGSTQRKKCCIFSKLYFHTSLRVSKINISILSHLTTSRVRHVVAFLLTN